MFLSWATDAELCSPRWTEVKSISEDGVYYFVCDTTPVIISGCRELEIDVFLTPKSHLRRLSLSIAKTAYGQDFRDSDGHFVVKLSFSIEDRFTFKDGKHSVILLNLIELKISRQAELLSRFYETEKHKIVSQFRIKHRKDMMDIRTIYVGRAQSIKTDSYGSDRYYVWRAKEVPELDIQPFTGVGYRSHEELDDIQRVQKFHLVSPRRDSNAERMTYEQDNDGYSNPNHSLPIQFGEGEAMNVQIFNLKFNPPKFIELQLRWAEFCGIGEKPYEVVYDGSISFVFKFTMSKNKVVTIREVLVRVKTYITVLNNLGDGRGSKTM